MIELNMPDEVYHSRPELSSTGARRLLESPARYQWDKTHRTQKREFDVGHAVHAKVLGTGAVVDVLDFDNFRTKAAQEARDAAYAAGLVPMLRKDMRPIEGMSEAVLSHPKARALFEQAGNPEVSVFATDPETGVDVKARFDYLPDFTVTDPTTVDLKTARSASPEGFAKSVAEYRYDIQQEWYLNAYSIETGDHSARMQFVVVETAPPYLVGVYPLADEFAELGRGRVRDALNLYAECLAADRWPGYPLDADPLQPPSWLMFQEGAIV